MINEIIKNKISASKDIFLTVVEKTTPIINLLKAFLVWALAKIFKIKNRFFGSGALNTKQLIILGIIGAGLTSFIIMSLIQASQHTNTVTTPIDRTKLIKQEIKKVAPTWVKNSIVISRPVPGPKVAIIITGLGISSEDTKWAISNLPPVITMGFSSQLNQLKQNIQLARSAGHEVMISLPMEPIDYPDRDPGSGVLLTGVAPNSNLERVNSVIGQSFGAIGFINSMGSKFLTSKSDLNPVLKRLHAGGYLFLEHRATFRSVAKQVAQEIPLPYIDSNIFLDEDPDMVQENLKQLQDFAIRNGSAVAIATGNIETMKVILSWVTQAHASGITLVPISTIYKELYTGGTA